MGVGCVATQVKQLEVARRVDSESVADLLNALPDRPARQLEIDVENFASMGIEPCQRRAVRQKGDRRQQSYSAEG